MNCCDNEPKDGHKQSRRARMFNNPRRLLLIAAVAIGAGLLFGWAQLVLFGIAPILISLLPCLVMCGLGVCMMCKNKKSENKTEDGVSLVDTRAASNPGSSDSIVPSANVKF